jgi:mono/diheme cytochrome c family protein
MKRLAWCGLAWLVLGGCVHQGGARVSGGDPSASLEFSRDGVKLGSATVAQLQQATPVVTFTAFDAYYQRPKTWRALDLGAVLAHQFPGVVLTQVEFVLRARDGYTVPISGARLLEGGAYLAFADADGPWEPIGAMKADPAPFYVVWRGDAQQDLATHPRPWALASVAIEPFERVFPKVVPPGTPSAQVSRGFALFREQCVRCHAINQEGGRVGPELNVPRNITEYRDEAFLRAWLANPSSFRVSAMPSFAWLPPADVDAVLAYLQAMAHAKVDVAGGAH